MLRQLMDRGLIRITGEDDSLGRPYLYGTTRQFLEEYGFGSLEDLPMADTLRRRDEVTEESETETADETCDETPQIFVEETDDEEAAEDSGTSDKAEESLDEDDEDDDEEWFDEDEDEDEAA